MKWEVFCVCCFLHFTNNQMRIVFSSLETPQQLHVNVSQAHSEVFKYGRSIYQFLFSLGRKAKLLFQLPHHHPILPPLFFLIPINYYNLHFINGKTKTEVRNGQNCRKENMEENIKFPSSLFLQLLVELISCTNNCICI